MSSVILLRSIQNFGDCGHCRRRYQVPKKPLEMDSPNPPTMASKIPMEILEMLSKVYGEFTMARSKVYEWPQSFKEGR
ncbi:hypothetical protein TNCV_623601 [Trichonephila clavipes]|nr:hypothetical protein TNCV_623601 [Trichonephila clavipes]